MLCVICIRLNGSVYFGTPLRKRWEESEDSDLPNSNLYLNENDAEDAMDYVESLILKEVMVSAPD